MSMTFMNEAEEKQCLETLKAFVEEYTPQYVTVALPKDWYKPEYSLGPTKLEFTTKDTCDIRVEFDNIRINKSFQLVGGITYD